MTWFSCKEYSKRASKRLDTELSSPENIRYWFHHLICFTCRRVNRQFQLLDKVFSANSENFDSEVHSDESLSDAAKKRLEEKLREVRDS